MDRILITLATAEDVHSFTACIFTAFTSGTGVRADFAKFVLPPSEATHGWFDANLLGELKRDMSPVMLKAVDTQAGNRMIGILKMQRPLSGKSYSAPMPKNANLDEAYLQHFFATKVEARKRVMGERPHWYLEIVAIVPEEQGKGYGRLLMQKCCEIIDQDGSEAYLESSVAGQRLYENFGFVQKDLYRTPEPWQEVTNALMVRPGKTRPA